MDAKLKANELYDKFYAELFLLTTMRPRVAKEGALIAVLEMINVAEKIGHDEDVEVYEYVSFLEKVKKEISTL